MSDSFRNPYGKPASLSNIIQGDDNNQSLNYDLNSTAPSKFGDVIDGNGNATMDRHNQGDHNATGKFNPFGDLPNVPTHVPGDPSFTRQLGPLMGGKHVHDHEKNIKTGDSVYESTSIHMNADISKLEKRSDEPDEDDIGLDSSRGKLKMD